jgi:hypothetical protein
LDSYLQPQVYDCYIITTRSAILSQRYEYTWGYSISSGGPTKCQILMFCFLIWRYKISSRGYKKCQISLFVFWFRGFANNKGLVRTTAVKHFAFLKKWIPQKNLKSVWFPSIDAQYLEIQGGGWGPWVFLADSFEGGTWGCEKTRGEGAGFIAFLCGSFTKIFIGGTWGAPRPPHPFPPPPPCVHLYFVELETRQNNKFKITFVEQHKVNGRKRRLNTFRSS